MPFWSNLMPALRAFRETLLSPPLGGRSDAVTDYCSAEERDVRASLGWAFYSNRAYRGVRHGAGTSASVGMAGRRAGAGARLIEEMGLYKHTRNIRSPGYRLVEFYAGKVWVGTLDPDAGDGEDTRSAIPIAIADDKPPAKNPPGDPIAGAEDDAPHPLRVAIGRLWKDSKWETNKSLLVRFAAATGDTAILIDDLPGDGLNRPGRVKMTPVMATEFRWVRRDPVTNDVTAYIREYYRPDPRETRLPDGTTGFIDRAVLYRETAELFPPKDDGTPGGVLYRTFLEGDLYAWNGLDSEWVADYPFIPVVFVQHESFGEDWGMSCFHAALSRFAEIDDQASGLGDQIHKTIRGRWFFAGYDPRKRDPAPSRPLGGSAHGDAMDAERRAHGDKDREEQDYIGTVNEKATATPMVLPLDIPGVREWIESLQKDIEANYPELMADVATSAGDASGRALQVARQVAEGRVEAVRPNYDGALVEAQRMAVAIGGERLYPGYEGFGYHSLIDGTLDHSIGPRAVFSVDPVAELEQEAKAVANFVAAVASGIPFAWAAERYLGVGGEELDELVAAKEEADALAAEKALAIAQATKPIVQKGTLTDPPPSVTSGAPVKPSTPPGAASEQP